MSDKQPDIVIEVENFRLYLKYCMGLDTAKEYAEKIGVAPQMVYMMLLGRRTPSPAILKAMGLKIAYVVDRSATPAKAPVKAPAKARAKKEK